MHEQPDRAQLEKLNKHRIKRLKFHGLFDPHDGFTKIGGSRQDVWIDKSTGELWVARKNDPSHYERMYLNPRERGIVGF